MELIQGFFFVIPVRRCSDRRYSGRCYSNSAFSLSISYLKSRFLFCSYFDSAFFLSAQFLLVQYSISSISTLFQFSVFDFFPVRINSIRCSSAFYFRRCSSRYYSDTAHLSTQFCYCTIPFAYILPPRWIFAAEVAVPWGRKGGTG